MASIGNKIRDLRIGLGLTQEELAVFCGTKKQTIHKYETGIISNIPASKIKSLADKLQTTPAYLMGWDKVPSQARMIAKKKLPMLGNVPCGIPTFAQEDYETYIDVDSDINADFCLTAQGDSMINARIFDGDILFVKKQSIVDNGEIAVVLIEDEATVKRVYYDKENNIITLLPENPLYKPMRYEGEALLQIRILGKVIRGQYPVK